MSEKSKLITSHVQRTVTILFSCQEQETMANPADHIPPNLSNDTIRIFSFSQNLPNPIATQALNVTAKYHSIYVLSFNPDDAKAISLICILFSPKAPLI